MQLSTRVQNLTESQTIAMAEKSRALKLQGIDIISLSLGEPDFDTPLHIQEAAKLAIDQHYFAYTPVPGYLELRQAICNKLLRDNQLHYTPEQIVVSTGAKQSLINVLLCLLNDGDEVLIPAPYWVSYYEMVRMAGGTPVVLPTSIATDYKATPEQIKAAITPRTRGFMFSSPSNPTGEVYSQSELQALADVFVQHPDITIISDEIYEYINFLGTHHSIAQCAEVNAQTVVINGFSKGFAMTGWRLGYIAAPLNMAKACSKMQGQFTSGTSSIMQRAGITALNDSLQPTFDMRDAFMRRRDIVYNGLKNIEGVLPNYPKGAFYIFPDISFYFGKKTANHHIQNAEDLAMYLLDQAHVAVVTGEAFGNPNCIRISFAASDHDLQRAVENIKSALELLQ